VAEKQEILEAYRKQLFGQKIMIGGVQGKV
jgi:hypothetical protein